MARKQQNDPLRYAANLTALAAAVYLGVTALLRLAVGQLLRLFNKSATLENPIAVPEWVLGVFNVLLPAAGLAAAFWLLAVGVRATPMRLRISVQMPRDGRLWLFVPVFLGAGFLCSLLTTLLQRLLAAFTRHVQRRMLAAQMENRRAVAAISAQVPEALHNIRTIHLLGLENYMERRYDKCIGQSYAAVEKTNFFDAVYSPVVLTINAVVVGVVMLLSASGSPAVIRLFGMSVGTAVAVINYISRIFAPIESLGMEIQTIQAAMAGVRRIDEFLAQPEREIPAETDVAPRGDVEFSHVTFGYDAQEILSDFSFTVQAGQQATLVGRTGAGKSTVFRLLLGLYQPESGSITIGGVPVSQIPDSRKRRSIGCVEQHFSRVPGSVLDQITLGDPLVSREDALTAARLAGLDEVIALLPQGYDTPCTEGLFSQGQWQLLSIARAVAADPGVLLLDEITANLDARTEERVLEALRRASSGRTVLSISHRTGAQTGIIIHL